MIILAATPIGNLGDATRRLVEALESAQVIASEDTRTTQRLLVALGIQNRPRLIALHDHNEKARAAELVELARETDVLLLSDAGMPTISDPGFGVVATAAAAGVGVTVLPGPSAVVSALAVSGLPTDRFTFEGFLPRKGAEQRRALAALAAEPRTMVFFEAPSRLAATLAHMAGAFGADRAAAVCRELTKLHEEVRRGTLAELAAWAEEGVRGEIVVVVSGSSGPRLSFEDAVAYVADLLAQGKRLKDASAEVAAASGHSARELYNAVLARPGEAG
ncbi:16S rRNA (cytidine(1402)-2'-O)-methyltransferase [Microbacterium schleiferi]|uniref:Ribosomal RNA small subunit methyltransferase I n=1 Tax=Microbacterium schleiferi TaxID=69362 RepID=A0A7S8MV96_9MICO|nr:16S rRNA (cytidine(1402)-2'-O)-methyltransferase [Microbacterium schleiferi]QPE03822.1 16S rRNA (cytidine(1402)-2'-O)-methyltransferase [Microbacterium schleiferi]